MAMGVPFSGTPIAFFRALSLTPLLRFSDAFPAFLTRAAFYSLTLAARSLCAPPAFSDAFPAFLTRAVFYSLTLAARAL